MKRPILVAVIGYIIGILWGLYIHISIVPFILTISLILVVLCSGKFQFKCRGRRSDDPVGKASFVLRIQN